jgi:transcriptional/translational regulatory protein YebC/TACO1
MFKRKGLILVEDGSVEEDQLMLVALEAGAEDVRDEGQGWEIITSPEDFEAVKNAVEGLGITPAAAEITMIPDTLTEGPPQVLELIDALDEHDDVQNVYTNWDMPEDIE